MKAIRAWILIFVVGLTISGLTAFPLATEARLLASILHDVPAPDALVAWIDRVHEGLAVTGKTYPFIAYGTDWLAFAHLVIAMAFWGPWRDPVRNIWVIEWAMLCCVAIIPLALIAGPIRQLPFWWELIDMSFGVVGIIPLIVVRRLIKKLPAAQPPAASRPAASRRSPVAGRASFANADPSEVAPGRRRGTRLPLRTNRHVRGPAPGGWARTCGR